MATYQLNQQTTVDEETQSINENISSTTGTIFQTDNNFNIYYSVIEPIYVGKGIVKDLSATPTNSGTTYVEASYDNATGIIYVEMRAAVANASVGATVTGTLITQKNIELTPIEFTIPDEAGTYNLKFNLSSGSSIDAGNVVVDQRTIKIDETVDATSYYINTTTLPSGTTVKIYHGKAEIVVGIGIITDLVATPAGSSTSVTADYDSETGTINITMTGNSAGYRDKTFSSTITGTLTSGQSHTYRLDITLNNGDVVSTIFEV